MIRQTLERKSALVPKTLQYFRKLADPDSYIYGACEDEKVIVCSNDPLGNITHEAISWDRLMNTLRLLKSFIISQPPRYTTVWLLATTEPSDVWLPLEPTPALDVITNLIQIRGVIAGSVAHIGPSYSAYRGDSKVVKWWTREVEF